MSEEMPITVEEQAEWASGSKSVFHDDVDKEAGFFDQNDVVMLDEEDGKDNDTRSDRSEAANSHSSGGDDQSSDSGDSAVADDQEDPGYTSYHTKYGSYGHSEENGDDCEDANAESDGNENLTRIFLSESQQIQDMLREFASSVNARLEGLESAVIAIRVDLNRSLHFHTESQGNREAAPEILGNRSPVVESTGNCDPVAEILGNRCPAVESTVNCDQVVEIPGNCDPVAEIPGICAPVTEIPGNCDPLAEITELSLPKLDHVTPLQASDSVAVSPPVVIMDSQQTAALKCAAQRDPRKARPRTVASEPQKPPSFAATKPADKDAALSDCDLIFDSARTATGKSDITVSMPENLPTITKKVKRDNVWVTKSVKVTSPAPVFDRTKTLPQKLPTTKTASPGATDPISDEPIICEKMVSAPQLEKPMVAGPLGVRQSSQSDQKAPVRNAGQEETSSAPLPQACGSGNSVPAYVTARKGPPQPKVLLPNGPPSNVKNAAGSNQMRNAMDPSQMSRELYHVRRVQLQNGAQNAQGHVQNANPKLQLPFPRYIPAWLAKSFQAQVRQGMPVTIQDLLQQGHRGIQHPQLGNQQAQMVALQARVNSEQNRAAAQHMARTLSGQRGVQQTQMGGGQVQRDPRRPQQQQQPTPLLGIRLRQSQQVDKVVEQLCGYISSYDLSSLRDAWSHLDQRVFSRLEHQFMPTVRKLEGGLLKMYVVNTVQTNRADKLLEFFEKMSPDLQNQPEWKEWFVLPFVKNPEENPVFSMYFTKQWQDTMLVSMHNFLSVIFQSMPLPTLLSYGEEQAKMANLLEENEALKQKLAYWQSKGGGTEPPYVYADVDNVESEANELMDDFCVIAQQEPQPTDSLQSKSIRSLIRNISSNLPTSPILGRKQQQQLTLQSGGRCAAEDVGAATGKYMIHRTKSRTTSSPLPYRTRVFSENEATSKSGLTHSMGKDEPQQIALQKAKAEQIQKPRPKSAMISKGKSDAGSEGSISKLAEGSKSNAPFILLSQDEYREHHSTITHCKFNSPGSVVASADVNGVIKIWMPTPSPQTIATVMSKSSILALEWASKLERLLLLGNRSGTIRLYDIKDKKTLCEVGLEQSSSYREQRITCIACSPIESTFICCSTGMPKVPFALGSESAASAFSPEGRISIWDMKLMKCKKSLNLEPSAAIANCCAFNHNGQLLLVGAADGRIRLFDMRCDEGIATWQAHRGNTYSIQFSTDETSCYSLGEDGKFIQWNVNKNGEMMSSTGLHEKAAGPFSVQHGGASTPLTHNPAGKLFATDAEGRHILTCAPNGGMIYSIRSEDDVQPVMSLGGHGSSVVTVDWASVMDCGTCITASLDGEIKISTLLAK